MLPTEQDRAKAELLVSKSEKLVQRTLNWSGDDQSLADHIQTLHRLKKKCQEEVEGVTAPAQAIIAKVQLWWKPGIEALDRAIKAGKGVLDERRAERIEAQREALEEAATPQEVAQAVAVLAPAPKGTALRKTVTWEVEDEGAIPNDYWMLDEKRIGRETKAGVDIPGIRVTIEQRTVLSGSKQ